MIRKYKQEEIPTLLEIWEQASSLAHPFLSPEFSRMVKSAMEEKYLPDSDTWVYEESNQVVGFISMIENEIGGLFVLPNHHSKGIGTALIHQVAQFHTELEVEVFEQNKIGRPFYEKLGFKSFKEYTMDGTGQEVIRMKKQVQHE